MSLLLQSPCTRLPADSPGPSTADSALVEVAGAPPGPAASAVQAAAEESEAALRAACLAAGVAYVPPGAVGYEAELGKHAKDAAKARRRRVKMLHKRIADKSKAASVAAQVLALAACRRLPHLCVWLCTSLGPRLPLVGVPISQSPTISHIVQLGWA